MGLPKQSPEMFTLASHPIGMQHIHQSRRTFPLSAIVLMTIASSSRSFPFRIKRQPSFTVTNKNVFNQNIVPSVAKHSSLSLTGTGTAASNVECNEQEPSTTSSQEPSYHLVLVGGGHAHVQVVKALANRPRYLKVTLIDRQCTATYSGMVPGCIAGLYKKEETQIDIHRLATEYAAMDFIHDQVVDIDFELKRLYLKDSSSPISFDVVSLDIGSTVRNLDDVEGATQYTIPTRPIDQLVDRLNQIATSPNRQPRIVVIGGGVAGIELSMAASARLAQNKSGDNNDPTSYMTTLLDAGNTLLSSEPTNVRNNVMHLLNQKYVRVEYNCQVTSIDHNTIYLKDGRTIPYQHCIWATGAGAHPLARHLHTTRGIACDQHGWFVVQPTLQSTSHPFVFCAGDCATIYDPENPQTPSPPKAGVYAVRSGPILIENLTRYIDHLRKQQDHLGNDNRRNGLPSSELILIKSRPQEDFMKLLVCGDGCAFGIRFGMTIKGKWVLQMKDEIDRSFMDLFNVTKLPPPSRLYNGSYDTSQYDAKNESRSTTLSPRQGAALLQRSDCNVDFREAWKVLRKMGQDEAYRQQVLTEADILVNIV